MGRNSNSTGAAVFVSRLSEIFIYVHVVLWTSPFPKAHPTCDSWKQQGSGNESVFTGVSQRQWAQARLAVLFKKNHFGGELEKDVSMQGVKNIQGKKVKAEGTDWQLRRGSDGRERGSVTAGRQRGVRSTGKTKQVGAGSRYKRGTREAQVLGVSVPRHCTTLHNLVTNSQTGQQAYIKKKKFFFLLKHLTFFWSATISEKGYTLNHFAIKGSRKSRDLFLHQ